MIEAEYFVHSARSHGFSLYAGVPCSYLKPFINYVIESDDLCYVGATNEGDAVAIAAGAELGGRRSVAMFQNSGLGNAVNPLTSLTHVFKIPILLITTLRGEPGGPPDEPQHQLMGGITTQLLDIMEIPWSYFPTEIADVEETLSRAVQHMEQQQRPYALVMRKGSVAPTSLMAAADSRPCRVDADRLASPTLSRQDMLMAIQSASSEEDVIVATTGYTGRELYAAGDKANQIYLVGSMGCAMSVGLGLAIAQPQRRIIVIDGDGAALMRLGGLCTVGYEGPKNLVHVLLDNGMHESTGGQSTVSRSINFPAIAGASGYTETCAVSTAQEMREALSRQLQGPLFVHAPIVPGVAANLPRPEITPPEVARRLRTFLAGHA